MATSKHSKRRPPRAPKPVTQRPLAAIERDIKELSAALGKAASKALDSKRYDALQAERAAHPDTPEPASTSSAIDEENRDNVLAYADGMQSIVGVIFGDNVQACMNRGREQIKRWARDGGANMRDDGRLAIRLTLEGCADVLSFMGNTEPIKPMEANDEESPNRYCGYILVVEALEESLRSAAASSQDRIEAERQRLFNAIGIVRCVQKAVDTLDGSDDGTLCDVGYALAAAEELLNGSVNKLELIGNDLDLHTEGAQQ